MGEFPSGDEMALFAHDPFRFGAVINEAVFESLLQQWFGGR